MKWEPPIPPPGCAMRLFSTAGACVAGLVFWPFILSVAAFERWKRRQPGEARS